MRKYLVSLILLISCNLLFNSCAPTTHYTQSVYRQMLREGIDTKKIQYYSKGKIVLTRVLSVEDLKSVDNGNVKIVEGVTYEEIVIPSGTPGVLFREEFSHSWGNEQSPKLPILIIEYEDGKTLVYYPVRLGDWRLLYEDIGDSKYTIYGGSLYKVKKGLDTRLAISKTEFSSKKVNRTRVKGKRVN